MVVTVSGRLGRRVKVIAQHDSGIFDADFQANVPRHQFVVAGQDFDVHSIALHGRDRGSGIGAWRIRKCEIAGEDEVVFIGG
jgi:hypothetical protein